MKPFLTNVRHILKAGVSLPARQPDPPDVLHFGAWSLVLIYLFYPPAGVQDHSQSSWQLQLVKVLKCRLVERQVGVGWAGGGSNCTGGQNQPNPNHRTEMPPGRGEDRFEGKCTTEPVAHLWFVGQLGARAKIFLSDFPGLPFIKTICNSSDIIPCEPSKTSCLVIWGHCAEKADVGKGQPGPHLDSHSVEGGGSIIRTHNKFVLILEYFKVYLNPTKRGKQY